MTKSKQSFNKEKEIKIYGLNQCLKVFEFRPNDIIRLYCTIEVSKRLGRELQFLSKNKRAYHIVTASELEKLSSSFHHEGIVLVTVKKSVLSLKDFLKKSPQAKTILALEDVSNPHNIGAILRSAAHFGVDAILLKEPEKVIVPACYRTSEGGIESVEIIGEQKFFEALNTLKLNQYEIISTSSHKGNDVFSFNFPKKLVLLLGEEGEGLSNQSMKLSNHLIQISGTNKVESLNVSVATAVILAQIWKASPR